MCETQSPDYRISDRSPNRFELFLAFAASEKRYEIFLASDEKNFKRTFDCVHSDGTCEQFARKERERENAS